MNRLITSQRRSESPSAGTAPSTPQRGAGTCAWCRRDFSTISQLLDHVDGNHLL